MFLIFPSFNLLSTPLLILVIQGLLFAFLLLRRYFRKKYIADLFVCFLLILTAYQRTSYTIGFMDWYDTFRNTKINYYLVSLTIAIGPLIYLYVKSLVKPNFKFRKIQLLHFLPALLQILYYGIVFVHDASQPGFSEVQNGEWYLLFNMQLLPPLFEAIEYTSYLLYFAFTIQLFVNYKIKIEEYFSNTYNVELNWIRNFLIVYISLIAFEYVMRIVGLFTSLSWVDRWWIHFFSSIALVYLGIKAYFTDLSKLYNLTFNLENKTQNGSHSKNEGKQFEKEKNYIEDYFKNEKPYLETDLTLPEMSKKLNLTVNELSFIINNGYEMNFNDFINNYRVEEVKKRIVDPKNAHMSLLGIAMDCGFNSKATFNRVFKKFTTQSPSSYLMSHKDKAT